MKWKMQKVSQNKFSCPSSKLKFFESKLDYLESEIDPSYGSWNIYYTEGTLRKWVRIERDTKEKEKELGGASGAVKDDDFRKDTLKWGCHVVPRFEKLIKEIVEEYIEINGKILTSQKGYSG